MTTKKAISMIRTMIDVKRMSLKKKDIPESTRNHLKDTIEALRLAVSALETGEHLQKTLDEASKIKEELKHEAAGAKR